MPELPFLHPALLGIGVAAGIAWSALAPRRLLGWPWAAGAGVAAAAVAGLAGWVPWTGGLRFTAYAACLLAAFALAVWLTRRRMRTMDIPADHLWTQTALAAVAGIVGARAWYVVEYRHVFPSPSADFGRWLTQAADLDRGGAVYFGGLLLAGAVLVLHTWRARVPLAGWADCVAPGLLAAQAVGRIGCLLNGCCYGAPCDLPWAVQHGGRLVHPTQLYETLACAVLALVALRLRPGGGMASGFALLGYAVWRFLNEMLRGDYGINLGQGFSLSPFHLTSAQWFCLPLAAAGAWLMLRARRRREP